MSNVMFNVSDLFIKEGDRQIVKIGYYYKPTYGKSNIRVFRHIESPVGQVDLIFSANTRPSHGIADNDLCNFLSDPNFLTLATNTVATFPKEILFKASRLRLDKFHDLINGLPVCDW